MQEESAPNAANPGLSHLPPCFNGTLVIPLNFSGPPCYFPGRGEVHGMYPMTRPESLGSFPLA